MSVTYSSTTRDFTDRRIGSEASVAYQLQRNRQPKHLFQRAVDERICSPFNLYRAVIVRRTISSGSNARTELEGQLLGKRSVLLRHNLRS